MLDVATRNALNALYSAHSVVETVPTHIPASASPIVCTPFPVPLELNSTDAKTKGAVTRLQKLLASDTSVYPAGKVTGFFGPATEAAVKAFQVKKGIAAAGSAGYGVVGPATNKALATLCASL
jgi:peptidoglycan hydrolase-like protein with peptidoglycan-binding domain